MCDGIPGDGIDLVNRHFENISEEQLRKNLIDRGMIVDPLSVKGKVDTIPNALNHLASQENCDGEPYDQMVAAAEYIEQLENILYPLARLARNTDDLHPSSSGPAIGALLLRLRLLNGNRYSKEVIE